MNVSTTSTIETTLDSPTSEQRSLGHLSASTLSMRAKAERKRKASARHNNNFRAGFVPVTEETLHRTGIRGRKRYFLYCTLAVMMIIALLNTLVTVWLVYIFGMTHTGLHGIEVSSYGVKSILRILHEAHITTVTMNDAPLGARYNSSVDLLSDESPLFVRSASRNTNITSSVTLEGSNITLTTKSFKIRLTNNKQQLSTDLEYVASNIGVSNYHVEGLVTGKVTGKINSRKGMEDVYLESLDRGVSFNATNGMRVMSQSNIEFKGKSISLHAMGKLIMSSKHGVYLHANVPKVQGKGSSPPYPEVHKVCACRNGQLFLMPYTSRRTSCRVKKEVINAVCRM